MVILAVAAACHRAAQAPVPVAVQSAAAPAAPPAFMLGNFVDDYGTTYSISPSVWRHGARNRYHVVAWHTAEQYLIVRNDSANQGDGGKWGRIDWMEFSRADAWWPWGFCFSAYQAPSADSARASLIARRETPRTGCNGYPFSRMRNAAQPPVPDR